MIPKRITDSISALANAKKWVELRSYFTFAASDDEWAAKCIAWCRFFLPAMFSDPTPDFHFDLVKRLLSKQNEYVAVPRGFAKTSLAQGVMCFIAAHRLRNFVVIVEKSFTEAAEVLSVVRETFTDNQRVLGVYGRLSKVDERGIDKEHAKETEGDLLINGTRFRAKGFETPIRGLKSGAYRPDFVLVDDVEMDEHVRNEEQRRKYRENFTQGIIPALDIGGQVKVIGTILHNDSLLKSLIDTHNGLILKAFDPADPENTLLWPTRWTYARLMEKKQQMEIEGSSSKFCNPYDAPILMADWSMKPIGEIKEGDEIVGFLFGEKKYNKLVKSKVRKVFVRQAKTVQIFLSNGQEIRCTPEHRWYTGRTEKDHSTYAPAKVGSSLLKIIDLPKEILLEERLNYRYLSGIIDGEGACKYGSIQISQSEEKNPEVFYEIKKILEELGIEYKIRGPYVTKRAASFVLGGGREMKAKLLWYGSLAKRKQVEKTIWEQPARFVKEKVKVERIEDFGEETVYALETETGNYVVWGYASSNSQEYMNSPLDDDSRRFHWQWLQQKFNNEEVDKKLVNRFAVFDGADAKGISNDFTGLTIVDIDIENNWFVRHVKQKRVDILETIDWIFEVWGFFRPSVIGFEKNAFEYQVRPLLKQRSEETGIFPIVVELPDGGRNKEARIIGALQGRFQAGKIFFQKDAKDDSGILISQAYDFPRGKYDDLLDSLAYHSDIGKRPFNDKGREDLLPVEHQEFYRRKNELKMRSKANITAGL